ncbi:hypothetical protein PENSPDRAFT_684063 [Peniophora sp. CONT]|nr:hypothetical protein PENSPDRAFT_684063 [Peniophora sp. CONT]
MRYSLRNTPARQQRNKRLQNAPPLTPIPVLGTGVTVIPPHIPAPPVVIPTTPVYFTAAAASTSNNTATATATSNANAPALAGYTTPRGSSSIYLRVPKAPRKTGLWKEPSFPSTPSPNSGPVTPAPGPSRRRVNLTTEYISSRDSAVNDAKTRQALKDARRKRDEYKMAHEAALREIQELRQRLELAEAHISGHPSSLPQREQVYTHIQTQAQAGPSNTNTRRLGPNGTEVIDDIPHVWVQEAAVGPNGTEMFREDGRRVFVNKQKAFVGDYWRTQKELLGSISEY